MNMNMIVVIIYHQHSNCHCFPQFSTVFPLFPLLHDLYEIYKSATKISVNRTDLLCQTNRHCFYFAQKDLPEPESTITKYEIKLRVSY